MIDLVLGRAAQVVVREELETLLKEHKLRVKLGVDPTGANIHLGRASTFRRLRNLQDMGHHIILIVGDFTAKIGDASDKTSERQPLSDAEITANMADYKRQIGQILDMSKVEFRHNSEWLSKLPFDEVIGLAQQFTVAQMIERENYAIRFKEQKPIGLHEFLYPILQGYDSVAIKSDLELGGTDQLFNLLAGRTIQKHYGQKPQQVMTFDLLTGPDGRKMSTSWGNAIYITDEPNDMYGKLMRINDELIAQYYRICTDIEEGAIEAAVRDIAAGANPRDTKASLAREIVRIYHGEDAALAAEDAFTKQFRDKQLPDDIPELRVVHGTDLDLLELLAKQGVVESKSEGRRLMTQGAIRHNGVVLTTLDELSVDSGDIIQVGKRRFVRITVK